MDNKKSIRAHKIWSSMHKEIFTLLKIALAEAFNVSAKEM